MAEITTHSPDSPARLLGTVELLQELVHVYDLLDIALRLAALQLEQGTTLMNQQEFWNAYQRLGDYLDPEERHFATWLMDSESYEFDRPTVARRAEVEGQRRQLLESPERGE